MKVLVINGPNINLLGLREPDIYGKDSYQDLLLMIGDEAERLGIEIAFIQSNHEGVLVDAIQEAYGIFDAIILNPAAYTHTSIAIRDALKAVSIPTIEVHLSDPDSREDFRKVSYIRDICETSIIGKGAKGYIEALQYIANRFRPLEA